MTTDTTDGTNGQAGQDQAHEAHDAGHGHGDPCGGRHQAPPFAENIQGLVDDLLEGVRSFGPVAAGIRHPRHDFVETHEAYLLVFDLPGVARDAVSVKTEGEDVIVSGARAAPEWGEGAKLRRGERAFGEFRRAVRMPADVKFDAIKARLEDGVLTVTLPRRTDSDHSVDIEG